ncbi:MAG TPA: HAD family hydrolase [Verrucomicrobiae bacterium]|nr:HAD family hydrolase [Verrucomicrobiae bacterium]
MLTSSAILFDLDGVLVDSTPAVERVWRRWATEHGLDPEFVMQWAHGRRSFETIRRVAPYIDAARENLKVERREIEDLEGVRIIPGAAELIASIPPGHWTIVTSATRELARARLGHVGLPLPAEAITAEMVQNGKPDPEPYLKGAMQLAFAPKSCIVIEDTAAGIASAKRAGMQAIALTTTYPAHELREADIIVRSCADIRVEVKSGDDDDTLLQIFFEYAVEADVVIS